MKHLITFIMLTLILITSSCQTGKDHYKEFIIYRNLAPPIQTEFLILKTKNASYERCYWITSPDTYVYGKYFINRDTLFLNPKYEYSYDSMSKLSMDDLPYTEIPTKYLIKNGNLIDITEYEKIDSLLGMFIKKSNKVKFYKLKKQKQL